MNSETEQKLNNKINLISDMYIAIADRIKNAILACKTSGTSQYLTQEESIIVFGGANTILKYAISGFDLNCLKQKEEEILEVPNG